MLYFVATEKIINRIFIHSFIFMHSFILLNIVQCVISITYFKRNQLIELSNETEIVFNYFN